MRRTSAETIYLIQEVATERFAADGYERTTIRAVAADAGIDPALVMRYFGSKERLFASAVEIRLQLPDLGAMPRRRVGHALAAHFLEQWEKSEALSILLRVGVTHPAAGDRIRAIFDEQLYCAVRPLVSNRKEAARRAGLVATQILGMALCRYVLKLGPVVALTNDEVVAWLGPTLQRSLAP
jgi:AcrR family transcriptional regulator